MDNQHGGPQAATSPTAGLYSVGAASTTAAPSAAASSTQNAASRPAPASCAPAAQRPAVPLPRVGLQHGRDRGLGRHKCKAYNQVCTSCKKIDHFQAICRGHHLSSTALRPKTIAVNKEATPKATKLKLHLDAMHMCSLAFYCPYQEATMKAARRSLSARRSRRLPSIWNTRPWGEAPLGGWKPNRSPARKSSCL